MEEIIVYCKTYWKEILFVFCCALSLFFPKYKKIFKELDMKFKTNANLYGVAAKGQKFDEKNMKPIYRLNKASGELELTGDYIDMDELIQSARSTCLEAVLEKFETLRKSIDTVSDEVQVYQGYRDTLDDLTSVIDCANAYRDKFNLPDTASVQDIFNFVEKKAVELKAAIDLKNNLKGANESEEKKDI